MGRDCRGAPNNPTLPGRRGGRAVVRRSEEAGDAVRLARVARLGELQQAQVGPAAPGGGFAPAPMHVLQVVAQVVVGVGTAAHQESCH